MDCPWADRCPTRRSTDEGRKDRDRLRCEWRDRRETTCVTTRRRCSALFSFDRAKYLRVGAVPIGQVYQNATHGGEDRVRMNIVEHYEEEQIVSCEVEVLFSAGGDLGHIPDIFKRCTSSST